MLSTKQKCLLFLGLISLFFTGKSLAQTITNITQNTNHLSIQDAINNAVNGDIINLSNGVYPITNTIIVNKEISIQGESESGVILDASGMVPLSNRVIETDGNNINLSNFTIIPITDPNPDPSVSNGIGFTIKAGANSLPSINQNLSLENISINGAAERTPFDIHGIDGVTLRNLSASNTSRGNGINITGCTDVNISGFSGSNNAWGAIGIFASRFVPSVGRGSDDVLIDGKSLSIDGAIYSQSDLNPNSTDLLNSNIVVDHYCYLVTNPDFRDDGAEFTFYVETEEDANTFAENLNAANNGNMGSNIIEIPNCKQVEPIPSMDNLRKSILSFFIIGILIILGYRRLF